MLTSTRLRAKNFMLTSSLPGDSLAAGMKRLVGFIMCLFLTGASGIRVSEHDRAREIPAFLVLLLNGDSLFDLDASEDSDFPESIPVSLLRGKSPEKPFHVLKLSGVTPSPVGSLQPKAPVAAPSQQGLYQRNEVLRI